VFGFDPHAPYDTRTTALRERGVAVWDVLKACRRIGSLDSAVQRDSMVPNDFATMLASHRTIRRILFNGAAAEANFRKLVELAAVQHDSIIFARVPSTSPAQTMRYHDKLDAWRRHLTD
jgi:hypoxanthine-DNA glycosylase